MLSCNKLVDIGNVSWGSLENLNVLCCSGNMLEVVPESLCSHTSLEIVYLGYNRIAHVDTFSSCERLKILHLGGNVEMTVGSSLVSLSGNARLFQLVLCNTSVSENCLGFADDFGDSLTIDFGVNAVGASVGEAETIGLRSAMEDRSLDAQLSGGAKVFAIFDGHWGDVGSRS
jgi:hypothetical protein